MIRAGIEVDVLLVVFLDHRIAIGAFGLLDLGGRLNAVRTVLFLVLRPARQSRRTDRRCEASAARAESTEMWGN